MFTNTACYHLPGEIEFEDDITGIFIIIILKSQSFYLFFKKLQIKVNKL